MVAVLLETPELCVGSGRAFGSLRCRPKSIGGSALRLVLRYEWRVGGEQRDDAIGFAQLVGAQDDRLVSVRLHHGVIVSRGDEAVVALGASRRAGRNSL